MQYSYAKASRERRQKRRRQRIRRIALFVGIVVLAGVGILAFQGWQIVSAIVEAEKSVVVPLPTQSASVELGGAANNQADKPVVKPGGTPPDDEEADSAPVSATDQIVIQPDGTPQQAINVTVDPPDVTVTPTEPAASPTAATPAPTLAPGAVSGDASGGPDVTPISAPVSTPVAEPTASPVTTAISSGPSASPSAAIAQDTGGVSSVSVLKKLLGQGLNSGDPGTSSVWGGKTTLNILVVGIDRRANGGDQNSDVIIIAQLDLVNKQLRAVSIPRDLLVEVPGYGWDKINSAYRYGSGNDPNKVSEGVGLLRDTIEYNFGVTIDDYVMIDFSGFQKVIDAIGGVDVDVPYEIYDPDYPTDNYGTEVLDIPAGETHMDGELALKYVRTRHADSDDQRRQRQMQVIQAIFEKGKTIGSINNIDNMILALGGSAQTNFTLEQQLTLARLALQMDSSNMVFSSLAPPMIYAGTTDDGAWVYTGDMSQIAQFVQDSLSGADGGG